MIAFQVETWKTKKKRKMKLKKYSRIESLSSLKDSETNMLIYD